MDNNELNGPSQVCDNIIYYVGDKPLITKELIEFLKCNISNEFPNILHGNRDELLMHQGKLELISELEFLYNMSNEDDLR